MNTKSTTREFWSYTIPAVLGMLISGLYVVIDGIFIGQAMGSTGMSAIYLAWPLNGMINAVGLMIGMGGGAMCSLAMGASQRGVARSYIGQSLWLIVLLGVPSGAIVVLSGQSFMELQGGEGLLVELGNSYLQVIGFASPLVIGSIALPLLVRNLGAPRLATLAMLVGAMTNVVLDYVFIIVWQWGLYGAALATVIGESLSVLICVVFICSKHNPLYMHVTDYALKVRRIKVVIKAGFSSMLMYLYMSVVVVVHNMLLMRYGNTLQVAAYAVTGYIMSIYYMFAEGVSAGMQPLISYYYGALRLDKVRRILFLGLLTAVGSGVLMNVILLLLPTFFVGMFSGSDEALVEASVLAVRLHLFAMFLDGFIMVSACFFQAIGQARISTLVTVSNMLILFPFLATLPLLWGVNGVWLALPLSNICLSVVVVWVLSARLRQLMKQKLYVEKV